MTAPRIGFMQGRLCDRVDGKIQAFPWRDWELEFPRAQALDLRLMEWTLDQDRLHENPLLTAAGQARIRCVPSPWPPQRPAMPRWLRVCTAWSPGPGWAPTW